MPNFVRRLSWLLLAACGVLFFSALGRRVLWDPTESHIAETARQMLANQRWFGSYPPLVYNLTARAIGNFGASAFAARFWSAVFGLLTVGLVYRLGARWKSERAGLLAGSILATSFLFFALTQTLTLVMAFTFWMTLVLLASTHLLTERLPQKVTRWSYVFGLACGFGCLTNGLGALTLPPLVLVNAGLYLSLGYQLRKIPWRTALTLAIGIPVAWMFLATTQNHSLWSVINEPVPPRGLFFVCLPVMAAGFLPWAVFLPKVAATWLTRRGAVLKRDPVAALLMIWILTVTLYFSVIGDRSVACILPAFPALALLTGAVFEEALSEESMPAWVQGGLVSLVILFSLLLVILKVPLPFAFLHAPESAAFLHASGLLGIVLGFGVFVLVGVWGMRETSIAFGGVLVIQVMILTALGSAMTALDPFYSAHDLGLVLRLRAGPGQTTLVDGPTGHEHFASLSYYAQRIMTEGDIADAKAFPQGTWAVATAGEEDLLERSEADSSFALIERQGALRLLQKTR